MSSQNEKGAAHLRTDAVTCFQDPKSMRVTVIADEIGIMKIFQPATACLQSGDLLLVAAQLEQPFDAIAGQLGAADTVGDANLRK